VTFRFSIFQMTKGENMKVVCIDFETANEFRGSICSVGIATIIDGHFHETEEFLIKPHSRYDYFDPFNVSIHGITKSATRNALEINQLLPQIIPLLENAVVIAHNAAFDMSAMRYALQLYNIPFPVFDYMCTCKIANQVWKDLENYKLDTLCRHLKHEFKHHNAKEDAIAAGKILLAAMSRINVADPYDLAKAINLKTGKMYPDRYTPCSLKGPSKKKKDNTCLGVKNI